MATVRVLSNGTGWRVAKNGVTQSNHHIKSAAVTAAKRVATRGDDLVIQRTDGTIQNRRRVR